MFEVRLVLFIRGIGSSIGCWHYIFVVAPTAVYLLGYGELERDGAVWS